MLFKQILLIWVVIVLILTIRGIVPRYKTDALIGIIWKILLPLLLLDIIIIIIGLV